MVRGKRAGLFNVALAGAAASAMGFACTVMPAAVLAGGSQSLGLPIDAVAARPVLTFGAAALLFLLCWLALASCDRRLVRPEADIIEDQGAEWPEGLFEADGDDPFAELARGAHAEAPLDLHPDQIETASEVVHQLNSGIGQSEWPISQNEIEDEEERLRRVLNDIKAVARRA